MCDLFLRYLDDIDGYWENEGFLIAYLNASGRHGMKKNIAKWTHRALHDLGWL